MIEATLHLNMASQDLIIPEVTCILLECCFWSLSQGENHLTSTIHRNSSWFSLPIQTLVDVSVNNFVLRTQFETEEGAIAGEMGFISAS